MEVLKSFSSKDGTQVLEIRKTFLWWSWEFQLHKRNGSIIKYKNGKYIHLGLGEWIDANILFDIHFEREGKRPITH